MAIDKLATYRVIAGLLLLSRRDSELRRLGVRHIANVSGGITFSECRRRGLSIKEASLVVERTLDGVSDYARGIKDSGFNVGSSVNLDTAIGDLYSLYLGPFSDVPIPKGLRSKHSKVRARRVFCWTLEDLLRYLESVADKSAHCFIDLPDQEYDLAGQKLILDIWEESLSCVRGRDKDRAKVWQLAFEGTSSADVVKFDTKAIKLLRDAIQEVCMKRKSHGDLRVGEEAILNCLLRIGSRKRLSSSGSSLAFGEELFAYLEFAILGKSAIKKFLFC